MPGWLKLLRDHTQNILPVQTRAQKKKDEEEVQDPADINNSGAGAVDLEEIQVGQGRRPAGGRPKRSGDQQT